MELVSYHAHLNLVENKNSYKHNALLVSSSLYSIRTKLIDSLADAMLCSAHLCTHCMYASMDMDEKNMHLRFIIFGDEGGDTQELRNETRETNWFPVSCFL